jgi:hypothetical protein
MRNRGIGFFGFLALVIAVAPSSAAQGAPDHEAYVGSFKSAPTIDPAVPKQPPAPIDEIRPLPKAGQTNVVWIPGYWRWNSILGDFMWVSGIWGVKNPNCVWISGNWRNTDAGWQWVSGYWQATALEAPLQPAPAIVNSDVCVDLQLDFPVVHRPVEPVRPAVPLIRNSPVAKDIGSRPNSPVQPSAHESTRLVATPTTPPAASLAKPKTKNPSKLTKFLTHPAAAIKPNHGPTEESLMVKEASNLLPQSSRQVAPALPLEPAAVAESRATPAHSPANLSRDFDRMGSEPRPVEPGERPSSRSESHGSAAACASSKATEKK